MLIRMALYLTYCAWVALFACTQQLVKQPELSLSTVGTDEVFRFTVNRIEPFWLRR
jgi:hypothetical protein